MSHLLSCQSIYVNYAGKSFQTWSVSKNDYAGFSEAFCCSNGCLSLNVCVFYINISCGFQRWEDCCETNHNGPSMFHLVSKMSNITAVCRSSSKSIMNTRIKPCGCMPPHTCQFGVQSMSVNTHIACILKTLKEFNERCISCNWSFDYSELGFWWLIYNEKHTVFI